MPRDISGNYTLPAGNPVVNGTIIDVGWANPTMSDIAAQLNGVMTRDGLLAATAPIYFASGSISLPSLAFTAYANTGIYAPAANSIGLVTNGVLRLQITNTGTIILTGVPISLVGTVSVTGGLSATTSISCIAGTISGGQILATGSAPALGFNSGGGQVTQITSKATAVTLNTASGRITTHNASLAAGATVSFTFNNSRINDTDVVLICGRGNVAGNYDYTVDTLAAGSCSISIRNKTAGALAVAIVINFILIFAVD